MGYTKELINAQNDEGETPLTELITAYGQDEKDRIQKIEELLAQGADVNQPNHQGSVPLKKAIFTKRLSYSKNLIRSRC